jgi:hypothetical protein
MSNPECNLTVGEFEFLKRLKYDLFLTVAPRSPNYFGGKTNFKTAHKKFAFSLYCKVCAILKIERKRILYFGRSEFGSSNLAHLHLLFTLDKCRRHRKYQRVKSSLQDSVKQSLKEIFLEDNSLRGSFELHCTSTAVCHQDGLSLASYVCKEGYSPFRDDDYQNFIYPEDYIEDKFIEEVLKRKCLDIEVEESVTKTVLLARVRDGRWKDMTPVSANVPPYHLL